MDSGKDRKKIIIASVILVTSGFLLLAIFVLRKELDKEEKSNQGVVNDLSIVVSEDMTKITTRNEIEELAIGFLQRQEFEGEYDTDSIRVENYEKFWNVWFNKKNINTKPNKGLVQINKETGVAEWKRLD